MDQDQMTIENTPINQFADRWAFIVCLAGFFVWSCLLTLKFNLFGYYDWDLALYAQAMQSLCHGTTFASLFGASFLVDHSHYIAFLLTPIYALFPHPLTLVHLELFTFFGGAFIFYKIASKSIGRLAALALMVIYIVHPANVFMLFYEFHFESLATGFIFLMFYFWNEKKWIPFMVTAFLTMLIKENMALIVIMFGVFGLVFSKENKWRWGGIVFGFGLLFFVINLFVLMPYLRRDLVHTSNVYWNLYNHLGSTPLNILRNIILHPSLIVQKVCTPQNLLYLKLCIGPFLFSSIMGPQCWVGLPILAQNLLSNENAMHTIYFHYAATLIPFAAMGAVDALSFTKIQVRPWVFVIFMTLMILSSMMFAGKYWQEWENKVNSWSSPLNPARQSMIDQIPKDASVVSSFTFLSHLTDHPKLYAFYNVWRDIDYFTGQKPFKLPDNIQYALIDYNDPWFLADLDQFHDFTKARVNNFFIQYKWKVKRRYGKIVLYQRGK